MLQNQPEQNGKVDLVDMLVVLWEQRLKVIGTMFLSILITATFLFVSPSTKRGSVHFSTLPGAAFLEAEQILSVIDLDYQATTEVDNREEKQDYISSELALSQFVSEFRSQRTLREAAKLHSSVYLQTDMPADEKEKLAAQIAQSFLISVKSDGTGLIKFETQNQEEAVKILETALSEIFKKINATNKEIIQNLVSDWNVQQTLEHTYNEALVKIEASKRRRALELQILELKEQREIARQLTVKRDVNPVYGSDFAFNNRLRMGDDRGTLSNNLPYFVGLDAIEAGISILEKRRLNDFLDNQLRTSEAFIQFEMLKAGDKSHTLNEIMTRLNFTKPSFKPVDIELSNIKFKDVISKTMVLVFATMVGALGGILVALLANIRQRSRP